MTLDDPKIREALEDKALPKMSFGDHLDELRSRLVKALIAIVVAVVGVLPFKSGVQEIIIEPYRVQWRIGFTDWIQQLEAKEAVAKAANVALDKETVEYLGYCREHKDTILAGQKQYTYNLTLRTGFPVPYSLYATGGLDDMMSFMWASLVFAMILASPVVLWQIWAFIAAGLYQNERKVFYRYFPFMVVLMVAGVSFGYFVALPYSLGFLIRMMDPAQVNAIFGIGSFLTLLFALTGAMGLVFQLPLVMVALQRIGLVSHRASHVLGRRLGSSRRP